MAAALRRIHSRRSSLTPKNNRGSRGSITMATFFEHFLSDDHVEVGTNGIATKAQVVAYVGSSMCTVKSYSVDHFHATRFDDNTALLTYRAAQETTCGKVVGAEPDVGELTVRAARRALDERALPAHEGRVGVILRG